MTDFFLYLLTFYLLLAATIILDNCLKGYIKTSHKAKQVIKVNTLKPAPQKVPNLEACCGAKRTF